MCEICDNFGVIDDPLKAGHIRPCPACNVEPPWYFRMNMAAMLAGPEGWTEDDDMTEIQGRYEANRRQEEANFAIRCVMNANDPEAK